MTRRLCWLPIADFGSSNGRCPHAPAPRRAHCWPTGSHGRPHRPSCLRPAARCGKGDVLSADHRRRARVCGPCQRPGLGALAAPRDRRRRRREDRRPQWQYGCRSRCQNQRHHGGARVNLPRCFRSAITDKFTKQNWKWPVCRCFAVYEAAANHLKSFVVPQLPECDRPRSDIEFMQLTSQPR